VTGILFSVFLIINGILWAMVFANDESYWPFALLPSFVCVILLSAPKPLVLKVTEIAISVVSLYFCFYFQFYICTGVVLDMIRFAGVSSPLTVYVGLRCWIGTRGRWVSVPLSWCMQRCGLFVIKKLHQLYTGGWRELVSIRWENENCIRVDGRRYTVQ
jgi:hypothetical protein